MSKSELERQTDRTVAASDRVNASVQRQTNAIREQTVATHAQTGTIRQGFDATVAALHQQSEELRAVGASVQAVAHEMRGLREDIYAATQNREALEAKSKLERADQLLGSDLPVDALRLIREAEVLNPADFAVWSMKAMFCHRAVAGGLGMTDDEARLEGQAAVERAVKLFPASMLGTARSLNMLRWLAGASIVLGSESGFERAVETYTRSLDNGADGLPLSSPATAMARFLGGVDQPERAVEVARANGRLLVRLAQSGDSNTLRAILPAWWELAVSYPESVGPEVERAVVADARRSLRNFVERVRAADAQQGELKGADHTMFRTNVAAWLSALEGAGRDDAVEIDLWSKALLATNVTSPDLDVLRRECSEVATTWTAAAWSAAVPTMSEPPQPIRGGRLMFTILCGMLLFGGVMTLLGSSAKGEVTGADVMMTLGSAAGAFGPHARYFLTRGRPLPPPSTPEFVRTTRALLEAWASFGKPRA